MGTPDPHMLRVQQLFVRHQGQLRAFVLAIWPDFGRADDVLQEVFLTVTTKAADFQEGSNVLAWSRAITQRKVHEARRLARKPTISPDVLESLSAACPEGWAEDRRLATLAECLKSLPPRAEQLVRLRYHKRGRRQAGRWRWCCPADRRLRRRHSDWRRHHIHRLFKPGSVNVFGK